MVLIMPERMSDINNYPLKAKVYWKLENKNTSF